MSAMKAIRSLITQPHQNDLNELRKPNIQILKETPMDVNTSLTYKPDTQILTTTVQHEKLMRKTTAVQYNESMPPGACQGKCISLLSNL